MEKLARLFLKWMFGKDVGDTEIDVAALMDEGRAACDTRAECPYARRTRQRKAWMRGWTQTDHENLMLW